MCLHDKMIPYKDKFITTNSRIKIVDKTEKSIQELLRECKYLITDYSSVAFDFAYMKKPLQYFQFDFPLHPALHLQNIIASFHRKILKLTRLILSKKSQVYGTEVSQY